MENKRKKRVKKPLKKEGRSYSEMVKAKVVGEVKSGFHSHRTAAKLYGISRNTINSWVIQDSLFSLIPPQATQRPLKEPDENSKVRMLSKQVVELQKALEKANLKIDGLQTMIRVSEEELKIKIRKKPGAKRSKE
jgi:transposase-like protein